MDGETFLEEAEHELEDAGRDALYRWRFISKLLVDQAEESTNASYDCLRNMLSAEDPTEAAKIFGRGISDARQRFRTHIAELTDVLTVSEISILAPLEVFAFHLFEDRKPAKD